MPTACPVWSVHHLALHLIHDDVRRLSYARDGHAERLPESTLEGLVAGLDAANVRWVDSVLPSVSPRLTIELLEWLAVPTTNHMAQLDLEAPGMSVTWAGPGEHPNWLDVAREFSERWIHQQQIRDAVGRPGLISADYLIPVIGTVLRGALRVLPQRPHGTELAVVVRAPVDSTWGLRSSGHDWFFVGDVARPAATISLDAEVLWRRAVRMLSRDDALGSARVEGDRELAESVVDLRGAMVPDHET